ncbi:MAG: carotenoid biosynthesis protein [Chloroflexota bacterium]
MNRIWLLFIGHVAALAFGLGGILIALPNPHLWAGSEWGADVFQFGMNYGGSLHIVLGAATMVLFGGMVIGWQRTLIFFAVTVALSLSSELIGTGTGWPFGNYEYTSGLGYKVLGRVPFTIPLSWFYIGFASYLLANTLVAQKQLKWRAPLTVLFGAYLLTVWDLVLDPAMAHEDLPIRFWTWFETGAYFGMPVKNFGGWILTGFGVIAFLWLAAAVLGMGPIQDVLMVIAIFAAIATAGYTAFLFGQAKGRNYWQSPTVLPHLVAQAVTAGAAALIITGAAMDLTTGDMRILTWILAFGVVASVALIATEFTLPHVNAHVRKTVHLITDGPYSTMLYGMVGVVGTLLPLLFVLLALSTSQVTLFALLASLSALAGLLAYERIWVSAGQDVPLS